MAAVHRRSPWAPPFIACILSGFAPFRQGRKSLAEKLALRSTGRWGDRVSDKQVADNLTGASTRTLNCRLLACPERQSRCKPGMGTGYLAILACPRVQVPARFLGSLPPGARTILLGHGLLKPYAQSRAL